MYVRLFFGLQLIVASCADNTEIIRDYFVFKKINTVAGFSCGDPDNLRCSIENDDVSRIYDQAAAQNLFKHLHHWLILEDHGKTLTGATRLLNESTFSIITDFVISIPDHDGYTLYDVYNHCKHCGGSLIVTEMGTWTNNTGLVISLLESVFARRWNYRQVKVKVAGVVGNRPKNSDLITYLQEPDDLRVDNWAKFGFAITVHIAEMFNFSLDVTELTNWKYDDRNGPLMNALKLRKYDMGYYPSILTIERFSFADVTLQVWPGRTCFMFRTAPSVESKLTVVFRPFEARVWYTVFALSIVILLTLWLIWKLDTNGNYGESTLILVAALCQQGLPFENDQYAGRIAFLQTMIFGLLIYNCYSAAMVSSRLNIPLNKMNDSLYSLVKSKLKLSAHKEIYFNILINSPRPDVQYFKKHWEKIPEEKQFEELQDGIRTIMSLGHAYHVNPIDAYPIIERQFTKQMICQLTEVHLLKPSVLGLWTVHHSQFREITKIGIIRMYTSGIRNREIHRWTPRKPFCEESKRYVSSVTILETTPIIVLLLVGIALSAILCVIENIVFRRSKRKLIKQTASKLSRNVKNKTIIAKKKKPKTKILSTSTKK